MDDGIVNRLSNLYVKIKTKLNLPLVQTSVFVPGNPLRRIVSKVRSTCVSLINDIRVLHNSGE